MTDEKTTGLAQAEAEARQKQYGLNEVKEEKAGFLKKLLRWLITPIALMLLAADGLSLLNHKLLDFYFISFLIALNFVIQFYEEAKADDAVKKLEEKLQIKVSVLRDGEWVWLESRFLVPGDLIHLNIGDIIPADIDIKTAKNLTINESVLTGESLPKDKKEGEVAYSGSFIATGEMTGLVKATGRNTNYNKTLLLVEGISRRSILEQDILSISKLLSAASLVAVILLVAFFILFKHAPIADLLTLGLSLVIAGIPVSLPTVMTMIITLGVLGLAKKNAIVRRLSALEDLANVNLLLSDKTGTLTKNEINIPQIVAYEPFSEAQILSYALSTTADLDRSVINQAVIRKAAEMGLKRDSFEVLERIPADSIRKRASALIKINGQLFYVSVGASQIIEGLTTLEPEAKIRFEADVKKAAEMGYRVLAAAVSEGEEEKNMKLAGLLFLSDTLEPDSKETIEFMRNQGVGLKMLTGDNLAIGQRVAGELGLGGRVLAKADFASLDLSTLSPDWLDDKSAFSEILPIDKYNLLALAKKKYVVAVTGDGVNDLPAIKAADVGIAVRNAVDALKSAADIVLLTPGLSVIKDAVIEARRIFVRLYTYSIYRISESFRLIVTIFVIGLIFENYPLTPVQILLLAVLIDIPIISLGYNRVKLPDRPAKVNVKERTTIGLLFGLVGTLNSLSLFFLLYTFHLFNLSWDQIQTIFFLKLAVSGDMLVYVAHTKERWFKYLPSLPVILAVSLTQLTASVIALSGFLMPKVGWPLVIFVWLWAFGWMQVTELMKDVEKKIVKA